MSEGKVISDEKQCPFDGGTTEDKSTVTNGVFSLAKHSGKNQRTETEESSMSGTEKPIEKLKVKKQRRKRDKYLPNTAPLELPPCKICRKAASGIHYGINSCEACKVRPPSPSPSTHDLSPSLSSTLSLPKPPPPPHTYNVCACR